MAIGYGGNSGTSMRKTRRTMNEHTNIPYVINASAGTGKTTLLLQSVLLDLLERSKEDSEATIRNSLVITFTVAAAAEMRRRLENNISFCLDYAKNPSLRDANFVIGGDEGKLAKAIRSDELGGIARNVFEKAKNDIPMMQISTIDALDKLIVDRNTDVLDDVHPGYELVADDAMRHDIQNQVLDELFEQWYSEDNPHHNAFMDVLDNFGGPQKDADLRQSMRNLYETALTKPNRLQWLEHIADPYDVRFEERTAVYGANEFYTKMIDDRYTKIKESLEAVHDYIAHIRATYGSKNPDVVFPENNRFFGPFEAWHASFDDIRKGTWDELYSFFHQGAPSSLSAALTSKVSKKTAVFKNDFKQLKTGCEECLAAQNVICNLQKTASLWANIFALDAEHANTFNEIAKRRLEELRDLIVLFDERYRKEKKERSLAEFSDVAFWAQEALGDADVLQRLSNQWQFIYVDECQDDNALQNDFIRQISAKAQKLTMVGDGKQSIYGFRDASPREFLDIVDGVEESDPSHQSTLRNNHRSVPEILMFVNTVFGHLLTKETGDVDYLKEQLALEPETDVNRAFDPSAIEFLLRKIPQNGPDEDASPETNDDSEQPYERTRTSRNELQVDMIVRRVQKLCQGEDAQYQPGDIAVLARGGTLFGDLYDRLSHAGIPVDVQGVGDYYKRAEVLIALDWLKVIANAHQDIPMVSVMESLGFSDEELAELRLLDRKGSYFGIMWRLVHPSEEYPLHGESTDALNSHVGRFMNLLDSIRRFSANHPIDETLWHVYTVTGLYDYVGMLPEGAQRKANLAELAVKAKTFAATSHQDVRSFLNAVDAWSQDDKANEEASTIPTKNAVHIMTIHRAKGLQWPVVILMSATGKLLEQSSRNPIPTVEQISQDRGHYGIAGLSLKDTRHTKIVDTVQRQYLIEKSKGRDTTEELRLLYVALTRPEEKLIIAGLLEEDKNYGYTLHIPNFAWKSALTTNQYSYSIESLRDQNPSYYSWITLALMAAVGFKYPDNWAFNGSGTLDTRISLPKGMHEDDTGNSSSQLFTCPRFMTVHLDEEPAEIVNHVGSQTEEYKSLKRRVPVEGTRHVDDLALLRVPVSVSASGARGWLGTDADEPDEDAAGGDVSVTDDTTIADNIDEHDWRFAAYPLPDFMNAGKQNRLSPAEIGTAVHAVLELFDWSDGMSSISGETLLDVIQKLEDSGRITKPIAAELRSSQQLSSMEWFVSGQPEGGIDHLTSAILDAAPDALHREESFAMLIAPDRLQVLSGVDGVSPDLGGREIVVRGIIDGYLVDEFRKRIILFDYKTDAIRDGEDTDAWAKRLHDDYFQQQALYAEALGQAYPDYTVAERWLVGLAGHRLIDVSE